MKTLRVAVIGCCALLALPAASAKDFRPGDLRVCNATRCVPVVKRDVLPRFASFYYEAAPPTHIRRPDLGAPYYELRFRNGYVTGIAATRGLNRFLSYGVNLGRFMRSRWYLVPRQLAGELRRLTVGLRPFHLTRAALAKSH